MGLSLSIPARTHRVPTSNLLRLVQEGAGAMNDFYVGYLPTAPTTLARFIRKVIVVLGLLAATGALVLVIGQMPFANSAFEYGKLRTFEGIIETHPYPTL